MNGHGLMGNKCESCWDSLIFRWAVRKAVTFFAKSKEIILHVIKEVT